MPALDSVAAAVTAAVAGGAAMAAVPGDSLTTRNAALDQQPLLLNMWCKAQTAGFVQLTHPSGHDLVRDLRFPTVVNAPLPMLAGGIAEVMEPQETEQLTLGATGVAGNVELLTQLIYYPSLPGIEARLIDVDQLLSRVVDQVTVFDTTTAAASGAWSGARALNAASDLLKANTDYALLGAHIGATCGALSVRGTDSGNLRVSIPGIAARPDLTAQWFVWLTEQFGIPLIPVFNSANKAAIFVENVQDNLLAAVPFGLLFMQLSGS